MIAAVDSAYTEDVIQTAVVLFRHWDNVAPAGEHVVRQVCEASDYRPGEFYRRELPAILEAIKPHRDVIETIVIDGYVWLDDAGRPGLGAHLYEALDKRVVVVGVAKNYFAGSSGAAVRRGTSKHPLYVTAAGLDQAEAADRFARMAGPYRIPTLLRRVDRLSKDGLAGARGQS